MMSPLTNPLTMNIYKNEVPTLTSLSSINLQQQLHKSNESVVYLAQYHHTPSKTSNHNGHGSETFSTTSSTSTVVSKRLILRNPDSLIKFQDEADLLCNVLHEDERIVTPLAVIKSPPHYSIILPYYTHGSLRDMIHMRQGRPTLRCALNLALDMSNAIHSIHSKNICHRDIKFANFLVDDHFRAYLTDFGSAIKMGEDSDIANGENEDESNDLQPNKKRDNETAAVFDDGSEHVPDCKRTKRVATTADETQPGITAPSGGFHKQILDGTTLLYTAPEVLLNSYPDAISDIYSLGITLCELFTGIIPYDGIEKVCGDLNTVIDATYNEHSLTTAITHDNLRPVLDEAILNRRFDSAPQNAIAAIIDVIKRAWSKDPDSRPSALECSTIFQQIIEQNKSSLDPTVKVVFSGEENGNGSSSPTPNGNGDGIKADEKQIQMVNNNAYIGGVGIFATSGKRGHDKMEDRYTVSHSLIQDKTKSYDGFCTVIGIFDGHGGANAAEHCAKMFPSLTHQIIHNEAAKQPVSEAKVKEAMKNIRNGISKLFVDVDTAFRFPKEESSFYDGSGTTAIVAVLLRFPSNSTNSKNEVRLVIANAGDCRAVLCRTGEEINEKKKNGKKKVQYESSRLTRDHLASDPSERERVEKLGAKITVDRIGKYRVQGHIQVTRSIGDKSVKPFGVTAEPEITEYVLHPEEGDHFLVLGTDGVWDVLDDEMATKCVIDTAKEPGLAAKRVGSEAFGRGSDDNITAAVLFLSPRYAKNLA